LKTWLKIVQKNQEVKMAKATTATLRTYSKVKKSRPGIHAKSKVSKLKGSKNYKKAYKSQGR
jgi:hypothetical protein